MDSSRVLQSFDTLWFFHDVLAPKTKQIDPPNTAPIKEEERSPEQTDQVLREQHKSPEIDPQSNSGEIGFEFGDEIKSEIAQPSKIGEIEFEIGAKLEPEIADQPKSGEIGDGIEPDLEQQKHPDVVMEFKTTAATIEKPTEKRRMRRRRSRRKTTGERDLLRRPALTTPGFSEYWYGYLSGGNQWRRTIEISPLIHRIASTAVK